MATSKKDLTSVDSGVVTAVTETITEIFTLSDYGTNRGKNGNN